MGGFWVSDAINRHEGRKKEMEFAESIKVALFVICLVFALLASIYGLIKLTSLVLGRYFGEKKA